MKFTLPDQLPTDAAELDKLAAQARAEINVFQARAAAGDDQFTAEEADRLEYLNTSYATIGTAITEATTAEETAAADQAAHNERVAAALEKAKGATAPAPAPKAEPAKVEPAAEAKPDDGAAAAEVVAEAEAATQEAAAPVTASAKPVDFGGAVTNSDIPATPTHEVGKRWSLVASAPNFAQHSGQKVDTAVIADGITHNGQFTGLTDGVPTVLATMERPQGQVFENYGEFLAELDRIGSEIPGHGAVSAKAMVAAGGWCAPSEQLYDFCETPAAVGLLSFPEMAIKRGGVIFPAEPDFSALLTGFHYTEAELQATTGNPPVPTVTKPIVEIPCTDEMIEYRLEAIGWGVKSGILQRRAWPELVKKFLDEFMVAHQYRVSAKSLLKVLAQSSAAKVIPTDAVLGATTSILNGLHVRATNLQIKTRKPVIEGIAPIWFRDVLRADLASRDGLDVLNVTNAQVDTWLADRGIYLQYDGQWQSLAAGKPGHEDTSWWPGSVDVVLYPAGTFWRSLQNVVTIGAQFDLNLLTQNRELVGFVEDEFQVGKRCYPSHLIRIPLCVNGAVGARESIDCSAPYAAKKTATVAFTGGPTGGNATLKFSANDIPSSAIANNASAANVDTALTGIDDGVTSAGDITVTGGPLPTAVVVTYPAELGDLELGTNSLTGGTSPSVSIS